MFNAPRTPPTLHPVAVLLGAGLLTTGCRKKSPPTGDTAPQFTQAAVLAHRTQPYSWVEHAAQGAQPDTPGDHRTGLRDLPHRAARRCSCARPHRHRCLPHHPSRRQRVHVAPRHPRGGRGVLRPSKRRRTVAVSFPKGVCPGDRRRLGRWHGTHPTANCVAATRAHALVRRWRGHHLRHAEVHHVTWVRNTGVRPMGKSATKVWWCVSAPSPTGRGRRISSEPDNAPRPLSGKTGAQARPHDGSRIRAHPRPHGRAAARGCTDSIASIRTSRSMPQRSTPDASRRAAISSFIRQIGWPRPHPTAPASRTSAMYVRRSAPLPPHYYSRRPSSRR